MNASVEEQVAKIAEIEDITEMIEEIKLSALKTVKDEGHDEGIAGLKKAVSLNDILLNLPRKFRRQNTGSNYENLFSLQTVETVRIALDDLIERGELERASHISTHSEVRIGVEVPVGRWEEGFALAKR